MSKYYETSITKPVFGDAAAIRATIPGLSGWGITVGLGNQYDYTACSKTCFASPFAVCRAGRVLGNRGLRGDETDGEGTCPAGASLIAGADDVVGDDDCACCDGSPMVREPATGACVDPLLGAPFCRAR